MSLEQKPLSERVAEYLDLDGKRTPGPLTLTRYAHGGGRLSFAPDTEHRTLVADFYHEGDREFYTASANLVPSIIREQQAKLDEIAKILNLSEGADIVAAVQFAVEAESLRADLRHMTNLRDEQFDLVTSLTAAKREQQEEIERLRGAISEFLEAFDRQTPKPRVSITTQAKKVALRRALNTLPTTPPDVGEKDR